MTDLEKVVRRKCVNFFLDLIILSLLKERELSGYDVMVIIYEKSNVLLSPGTIYPVLRTLTRQQLIQVRYTDRKKVFRLTDRGASYASLLLEHYSKFLSELKQGLPFST